MPHCTVNAVQSNQSELQYLALSYYRGSSCSEVDTYLSFIVPIGYHSPSTIYVLVPFLIIFIHVLNIV
jgi:hypothetical protein